MELGWDATSICNHLRGLPMAFWAQVALTAAGFLVACAMLILGTLTLVDRRANRADAPPGA